MKLTQMDVIHSDIVQIAEGQTFVNEIQVGEKCDMAFCLRPLPSVCHAGFVEAFLVNI